jgi:hypothetical protein
MRKRERVEKYKKHPEFIEEIKEIKRLDLLILRVRLYVEYFMDLLLEEEVEQWSEINGRLRYADKFALLNKFYDVPPETNTSIQKINELRNDVAHELEFKVDDQIESKIRDMHDFSSDSIDVHTQFLISSKMAIFSLIVLNPVIYEIFTEYILKGEEDDKELSRELMEILAMKDIDTEWMEEHFE